MEPAALAKARSLARYAFGCRKETIELTLTDGEAWEFIGWWSEQLSTCVEFQRELIEAHATHNPWPLLSDAKLMGFSITRALH